MKKERFKILKAIITILVLILIVLSSCQKDNEETIPDPPELPPLSTFSMDMNALPDTTEPELKSLAAIDTIHFPTYQHWVYAAAEVTVWNFVVAVIMVRPVISFIKSFESEPVYHRDGRYWTWSYSVDTAGYDFDAELKGQILEDSVEWEMRINNYLVYMGKHHIDRSAGYWKIKANVSSDIYALYIDWQRENDSIGQIKYIDINPESDGKGGYIHYGATYDPFNRFYYINKANVENLVMIEWNSETHEGRIINSVVFQHDNWNCWNQYLQDVKCE